MVKHGGTADRIDWLPNGIDLSLVPPPTPAPQNDKFTLMFAGSHGAANGLDQLLDAAKVLQSRSIGERVQIRLLGDGPEKSRLQRRVADEGIDLVEFLPPVTKHEVYRVLATADACLMLLEDSPVFRWGVSPNKLFDYLACARPVLFSVSTDFNPIDQSGAGVTVEPGDVGALADGIERLARMPIAERASRGERGRAYVEAHHNISVLGTKLEQVLLDTVERHSARRPRVFAGARRPSTPPLVRTFLYRDYLKPLFDRTAAALGIVLAAPLLVAIAIMVRIKCGSPVLFTQIRPGKSGRPFRVYKFRTMTDRRDDRNQPLPDGQRLTPFGQWLRSTSLDELPELWNVVRGEMSLVGPRPLLMEYLDRYTPKQARRHDVKPGVTGLAQVCGRNAISWNDKFEADLRYVDTITFLLDLKILWKTIGSVFRRRGISAASHATMPLFTGIEQDETSSRAISA
jgi:lipopolysaccharide/colanic/teichoic acid biosynthesis glycosyltransferase